MSFKNHTFRKGDKIILHDEDTLYAIAKELRKLTEVKKYYGSRKKALGATLTVLNNITIDNEECYVNCEFAPASIYVRYWEIKSFKGRGLNIKNLYAEEIRDG